MLHDQGRSIREVQEHLAGAGATAIAALCPEMTLPEAAADGSTGGQTAAPAPAPPLPAAAPAAPSRLHPGPAATDLPKPAPGASEAPVAADPEPATRAWRRPELPSKPAPAGFAHRPPGPVSEDKVESSFRSLRHRGQQRTDSAPLQGFFFNDANEDVAPPPVSAEDKVRFSGGLSALDEQAADLPAPDDVTPQDAELADLTEDGSEFGADGTDPLTAPEDSPAPPAEPALAMAAPRPVLPVDPAASADLPPAPTLAAELRALDPAVRTTLLPGGIAPLAARLQALARRLG